MLFFEKMVFFAGILPENPAQKPWLTCLCIFDLLKMREHPVRLDNIPKTIVNICACSLKSQPPPFTTWSGFWFCKKQKKHGLFPQFTCCQKCKNFYTSKMRLPTLFAVFNFSLCCLKCRNPEKCDFQNMFSRVQISKTKIEQACEYLR